MNIFALRSNGLASSAYKNLSKSQFNLQTTLERLSSGLRINKASDDSAGSAISTRMSNQIQSMKQANENAQQANNLIQTAESGLNDISGMLSRMRELAVQASTDTLNNTDRASIDLEYQALKNEVTRIANVTQYNEMDILNGTDYRNQVDADNSTADDVAGVSINNLSNDIRKGVYTLSDEVISVSGQASISNLSGANIGYDASTQPGNYTLNATVTTVSADYALQFDGNDYVNIPAMVAPGGNDARTLTAWIKLDNTSTAWPGKTIAGWGNDASNQLMDIHILNGVLGWHHHGGNQLMGSVPINPDTWYQVAATYDGTTQRFYVNGNFDASAVRDLNTGSGNVKIGKQPDWSGAYFKGEIDEVGIWDKALTATEISALYNSGSGLDASSVSPSNLQGYWKFNEGSGNTATDLSNNGNHGTLNGPTRVSGIGGSTSTTHTLAVTDGTTTSEIAYDPSNSNPQIVDFSDQGLGIEVDISDAPAMTSALLSSSKTFTVPETRRLTITDENDVQQSLQYQVGNGTSLDFSELGIELDIAGSYSGGLNGTQIEISPNRDLQVGADNDANYQLQLGISSITANGLRIDGSQVVDIDQARAAITSLDHATDMVNQERSYLGSMQNRLAFTMSNLISQTQNIEASRSSIEDADFAAEAADLAKNQILAQSATAMLAQASAISQNVLGLLS